MPLDSNHPQPLVSVGILTRNAGRLFHRVMDALHAQATDWPFEVVILDSASKDGTDTYASSRGARVVPYRPAKFRFGPARDALFEQCRGRVIVTISHDVVPAGRHWLAGLVAPILDGRAAATVGEQLAPPGGYAFYWDYHGSWMRSVAVAFDQAHGRIAMSCAHMAIRRDVWEKLRFGDCETIEDRVMQVKLHQGGYRMLQVKDAISYHGHDYGWKELGSRIASFALGWARLGWPYTWRHLLRDLAQPSRWLSIIEAFGQRRLVNWKEVAYPLAMCWMQYKGSRKA
jgi:rhamnosyltransferase